MRPACGCVCLCGYCIYIFPGNVKVSRSKGINISSFLTQYTTHELIVAPALKKEKKGKPHYSAIQWTTPSCAPVCVCVCVCVCQHTRLRQQFFDLPCFSSSAIFVSEHGRTQTCRTTDTHNFAYLLSLPPFFFFLFFYYQK